VSAEPSRWLVSQPDQPGDGQATSTTPPPTTRGASTIRQVIEALAPLERGAGSPGEEQAARWIATRLTAAGCRADVDEEQFLTGYANVIGTLAAAGAAAGMAALSRRTRRLAGLTAAAVTAAIADDISNGPRIFRRATTEPSRTWNVVGSCGDQRAEQTLIVLAHHDAAPTGAIFDERLQAWLGEQFPGVIERIDTSLPMWWPMLASPGLVALGAARDRRGLISLGTAGCLLAVAVLADIGRNRIVPGANDNLTAVAVLIALAERLRAEPVQGLRVVLASCGAEEVLQGGIYGFTERHLKRLDRDRTWVLNLDTVGSPRMILLEGEGCVVMEDYTDRRFRDLVARAADSVGVPLRRGMRARTSTDSVIPSRAGYATATLSSTDRYKALSNYHQMTDTPENVDHHTVGEALAITEAVVRALATNPWLHR
jgi:hypothetical protein